MVFPRNRVVHADRLTEIGIAGYRASRERSRAMNLLSEFNPFVAPERALPDRVPLVIPAGFFDNWQHGARRLVTRSLSKVRAERLLRRAARDSRIVHFWLHPENVASAPDTLDLVEDIVRLVARERDVGRCSVLTQHDYCVSAVEDQKRKLQAAPVDGLTA